MMALSLRHVAAVTLATLLLSSVAKSDEAQPGISPRALQAFRRACWAGAEIKSQAELAAFVAGQGRVGDSPLVNMSADGRRRFLASIEFQDNFIVRFGTADLEAELTMAQAYRVLSIFGEEEAIVDMPDARIVDDDDRAIDAWRAILRSTQ